MKMTYGNPTWETTGKEIFILNYSNIFTRDNIKYCQDTFPNDCIATEQTFNSLKDDILFTTAIKPNSKLFFSKYSKFPRLKLQNTKFKRVIKENSADYIITPCYSLRQESALRVALFYNKTIDKYICFENITYFDDNYPQQVIDYINAGAINSDANLLAIIKDATFIKKTIIQITSMQNLYILKLLRKEINIPLVKDSVLDNIVSNSFATLTLPEILNLKDMLYSRNNDLVNTALKMIATSNWKDIKNTISLLLHESQFYWRSEYTSNTLSIQLFNSLNYRWYDNTFPEYIKTEQNITELDKTLFKEYLKIILNNRMKDLMSKIANNLQGQFEIDYTIDVK